MFMPFQILGMWLRLLLALVFLGAGAALLWQWNDRRVTYVSEVRPVPVQEGTADSAGEGKVPTDPRRVTHEEVVRRVEWQFGLNWETLFLLGGLALIGWSLGGGWLTSPGLWRRGGDQPGELPEGRVERIRRPDGTELHVQSFGPQDAPVLVLTHGWGLDSEEWVYACKQWGRHYRLITWDLPGLGQSRGPANKDWSLEKLAHDLHAVLGLAGDRPVILLGHSIGGMISLTFCRLYPQLLGTQVAGLVIAHSTYTNPVKTTSWAGLYAALQKPVLEPLCHLMIWLAPGVWLLNWLSYWNGSAHRSTHRSSFSGEESRDQLNFLARYTVKAWPAVVARGMLGMFRYDATATLAAIPVPTLVVCGDQDTTCLPEASVFMSHAIPGAQLVTLQPARHGGLFEHHATFHQHVDRFVAGCLEPERRLLAR